MFIVPVVFRLCGITVQFAFLAYVGHGWQVPYSMQDSQSKGLAQSRTLLKMTPPCQPLAVLLLAFEPATAFNPLPSLQSCQHCRPVTHRGCCPPALRMTETAPALRAPKLSRRAAVTTAFASVLAGLLPHQAIADENGLAYAYFTAGDPRFLEKGFDNIKYKGVAGCEVGSLTTADGAIPAIKVFYKAEKVSYKRVLGAFWRNIDPTNAVEQFGVKGPTIVWVASDEEKAAAEASREKLDASTQYKSKTFGPMFKGRPIKTEIRALAGEWQKGPDEDQAWYKQDERAYKKAIQKNKRERWFDDAYEAVTLRVARSLSKSDKACPVRTR